MAGGISLVAMLLASCGGGGADPGATSQGASIKAAPAQAAPQTGTPTSVSSSVLVKALGNAAQQKPLPPSNPDAIASGTYARVELGGSTSGNTPAWSVQQPLILGNIANPGHTFGVDVDIAQPASALGPLARVHNFSQGTVSTATVSAGQAIPLPADVPLDQAGWDFAQGSPSSGPTKAQMHVRAQSVPDRPARFRLCRFSGQAPAQTSADALQNKLCTDHLRVDGTLVAATVKSGPMKLTNTEVTREYHWDTDEPSPGSVLECRDPGAAIPSPTGPLQSYGRVARWKNENQSVDWIIDQSQQGLPPTTSLAPIASDTTQGAERTIIHGKDGNQPGDIKVVLRNREVVQFRQVVDATRAIDCQPRKP